MLSNKSVMRFLATVLVIAAPMSAMADGTGPDVTSITSAVSWSTVVTAVLAVYALWIAVQLAITGGKKVVGAVKG